MLNNKGLYVHDRNAECRTLNKQLDKSVTALTAVLDKVTSAPTTSAPPAVPTAPPATASSVPTPAHTVRDPASYRAQVRDTVLAHLRPSKD